jgi:hypothetical protein
VIVRISGEGQYRLDDGHHDRLNQLDDEVVAAVDAGDEEGFKLSFDSLLTFVRAEGTELAGDDLEASDFILPPADLTFAEAGEEFTGDGLIPDPA